MNAPSDDAIPLTDFAPRPRLLVSVRSVAEAREAVAGGADLIDVKEPAQGALGMAPPDVIGSIAATIPTDRLLSVALGEIRDWFERPVLPLRTDRVDYAKLGPGGLSEFSDWRRRWRQVQQRWAPFVTVRKGWIAVLYADADEAKSPPFEELLEFALAEPFAGVLIDTCTKDGGRLLERLTLDELADYSHRVRTAGKLLALAGSLQESDLPQLKHVALDILAIRGAACTNGDRLGNVEARRVGAFRLGGMLLDSSA